MDQDKALKKILQTRDKGDLPYGFEIGLMNKIMLEAKRKKRRSSVLTLGLVSSVSVSMIAGTILLLKFYLSVQLSLPVLHIRFSTGAGSMFGFFFYIAFLALVLLGLDTYFRSLRRKPKD